MIKTIYLAAMLLLAAGCTRDRPLRVEQKNAGIRKLADPNVIDNLPVPFVNLPPGQRLMFIIPKSQAKELGYGDGQANLFVTHGKLSPVFKVWKYGPDPYLWELVLTINEN